uniref:Transposase n=1 Tax=Carnobacterium maltaromaticum TaxID=2751 RepID=A0A1Z5AXA1_CARML|nr:protein of unknown function [Carnobacterium maltaromaticum]
MDINADKLIEELIDNWAELATFFKYSADLRRIIYTANVIEGLHCQL